MSDDLSPEFQRELLDDFYTESDELFRQLRGSLTTLERPPGDAHALAKIAASLYGHEP